jgi:hypothetical protein
MSLLGLLAATMGTHDFTPDAVNWGNISFSDPDISGSNANQTISGITAPITLTVSWTGSGLTMNYDIDDGSNTSISNGGTLSISSGQTLSFTAGRVANGSNTVTVANSSDGGATLDTFTVEKV